MHKASQYIPAIKSFLNANERSMFALLEKLVVIQSGSHHKKGVDNVLQCIKDAFADMAVSTEIVEQALAKNESIRRAILDSCSDGDGNNRSAVAYRQDIPLIRGYVHLDYLKTTLGKMRRHLAEIRGCLRVIRYNPEEPITENQLGFVDSGLENCELLEELLKNLVLNGDKQSSD